MKLRAKSMAMVSSASSAPSVSSAPARLGGIAELPESSPYAGFEREPIPGSCTVSASMICYDYKNGRTVFKPSRALMPEIAGLRRESLTVKRDRIVLSYSF